MLNVNQTKAVEHFNGPCLSLAGPGSGKTTVLVERIVKLIEKGVDPGSILVITFTRDAALEMKGRFLAKTTPKTLDVTFGTFHSFFYSILKQSAKYRDFEIIKPREKISLFDECARFLKLKELSNSDIESLSKDVSLHYNTGENSDFKKNSILSADEFKEFLKVLKKRKEDHRLLDFDDMLVLTRNLLNEDKNTLRFWQTKYSYFLIDEFQDINQVQFECVKLLLENHPCKSQNIFGVGDDDQSIYGFRGASPNFMLDFPNVFKGTKIILLDKNYRSDFKIVNFAKTLIEKNKNRYDKEFFANSTEPGEIVIKEFADENEEALMLAEEITESINKNSQGDIAVLFRNKKNAGLLYSLLRKRGIKIFNTEEAGGFKDTEVCRDICSYLSLISGKYKRKDLIRIMNKPDRGLNRGGLNHETTDFDGWKKYYPKCSKGYMSIEEFQKEIEFMKGLSPFSVLNYLKRGIGYESYLMDKFTKEEQKDQLSILNAIVVYSSEFKDVKALLNDLLNIEKDQTKKLRTDEAVSFFTFHASKGLEFNEVYILDAIEGITPSKNAKDTELIEEERRMFYVAMTRAKHKLNLCYPQHYTKEKTYPSRFLSEMKSDM